MISSKMNKLNVAVIVISLSRGGAERSTGTISKILENLGHSVTLISIIDENEFEHGGEYYALGSTKNYKTVFGRKISKFLDAYQLFQKINFDVVIDGRTRPLFLKELIFNNLIFKNIPVVRIMHNSYLPQSFPKLKWQARYLYKNDSLIAVSKKAQQIVEDTYGFDNVRTINYPVSQKKIVESAQAELNILETNYVLFYGRFDNESKNLLFLLEAYSMSKLSELGIPLILVGKGPDKPTIENKIKELNLIYHVIFKNYTPNPMPYVKKALFTVMTSNFEGFPMTLIESLTLGTPVVTLDFISGPSEIIETGVNGILVTTKTTKAFSLALNKMVEDVEFYNKCVQGTFESIKYFDNFYIAKKWETLLNEL
ncbi:glycosyltransferase [Aquimarina agarilytica]|uniref:glycosyltransferase n=1 Tax=Aquimarina agarilytica TaxID=1087449 RepID=UPI000287B990|nr:glycosyltransferase [Aquimarina agarilytica]